MARIRFGSLRIRLGWLDLVAILPASGHLGYRSVNGRISSAKGVELA